MNEPAGTLESVVPIVALIALGMVLRRTRVIDDAMVEGSRRLIGSVALPAVLFCAFLTLDFQPRYAAIPVPVPAGGFFLLGAGHLFTRLTRTPSPYAPRLFTGFEFGMLGQGCSWRPTARRGCR